MEHYSENETFRWFLSNNSDNNGHFLTICYCVFVHGVSVEGLRFGLLISSLDNRFFRYQSIVEGDSCKWGNGG